MNILYDKRLVRDDGDMEYSFKDDVDNFEQTEDLGKALEPFFLNKSKGIHVAIICTDELIPKEYMQGLFYDFNDKDSDEKLCIIDPSKVVSRGWEHGNYFYTDNAENIIDALEIIINCAKGLGIDTSEAEYGLHTYREEEKHPLVGNIWSSKNAWYFRGIPETSQGCANICILLKLPEKYFGTFKGEKKYFPPQLEYIVRGISPQKMIGILRNEINELEKKNEEKNNELEEKNTEVTTLKKERDNYKEMFEKTQAFEEIKWGIIETVSMHLKEIKHGDYLLLELIRSEIIRWFQVHTNVESLKEDSSEKDYKNSHELEDADKGREHPIELQRHIPEQHKESTKDRDDLPNGRRDNNRDER